jgi:hypothetical protein
MLENPVLNKSNTDCQVLRFNIVGLAISVDKAISVRSGDVVGTQFTSVPCIDIYYGIILQPQEEPNIGSAK